MSGVDVRLSEDSDKPPFGRATGKTFRLVMKCLIAASSGGKVICISRNHKSSMHVLRMAKEISHNHWISHSSKSITFKGGGTFKVQSTLCDLTGIRFDVICYDD